MPDPIELLWRSLHIFIIPIVDSFTELIRVYYPGLAVALLAWARKFLTPPL
ncbi:hypothetical protein H6G89_13765 [Oscillatoria sp. FACHB-1407]|uniref:hypothetical protein n=1 Tax=Oscillatoria sp. FACHB-1407 TaxID=2692847 RepID=UPI0019A2E5A2|nr:hypothetical protein [Oscillatoria sp. FACHB-1407]